jgi:hypothetical protein
MKGHIMDKDDEILKKMLGEDEMPYLEDNGFTRAVMDSLPRRRASTTSRRTLIIIGGSFAGCAAFGALGWDGIRVLAAETVRNLPELARSLEAGAVSPAIYVAVSLCTLFPVAFALREKFR